MSDFDRFYGAATSGGVPDGCKYFSERAAPQVGPYGPKLCNKKKFDLLGHLKLQICPIESTKKGDIPPPVVKRGSSFKGWVFFPRIGAKPQCLHRLADIKKYDVCDHNIHYLSSTNLVLDEKKNIGPPEITDICQHALKHRENGKTASKGVVLGVVLICIQNDQKNRKFCNFQMGIEIVLDTQNSHQTRLWKAEVP